MNKKAIIYPTLISAVVLFLAACGLQLPTGSASQPPSATPVPAMEMTALISPQGAFSTLQGEQAPTPTATVGLLSKGTQGRITYTNADYGFTFQYPADWQIQGAPNVIQLSKGKLTLVIAYRRPEEEVRLGPGNLPPGDIETRQTLLFLGQKVNRDVLVFEDKVKVVFYTVPGNFEIQINRQEENNGQSGLVFAIRLQVVDSDYAEIDIPETVQTEVDEIIASLTLLP